jgi:uncharacterized protein (TIGR02246 family)
MVANTNHMTFLILITAACFVACTHSGPAPQGEIQKTKSMIHESAEARLRSLEDREEIRTLMIEYGRTLDQRDFAGFSKLFAQDAEYGGGGSNVMTKGPEAIAKLLEDIFRKNPTKINSPNFHLFANATIQVDDDHATALSKGVFIVRGDTNKPEVHMLATYKDDFIRENGVWKFKRRIVQSDIPSARQ